MEQSFEQVEKQSHLTGTKQYCNWIDQGDFGDFLSVHKAFAVFHKNYICFPSGTIPGWTSHICWTTAQDPAISSWTLATRTGSGSRPHGWPTLWGTKALTPNTSATVMTSPCIRTAKSGKWLSKLFWDLIDNITKVNFCCSQVCTEMNCHCLFFLVQTVKDHFKWILLCTGFEEISLW